MLQNARVKAFTGSELLRENQQLDGRGKITIPPPPPRLGLIAFLWAYLWTSPTFKTQFNRFLHHAKNLSPFIFLGGGHHDNSISLWEEILYGMLQKSILRPVILSFMGEWSLLFHPCLWWDLRVLYWNHQKLLQN